MGKRFEAIERCVMQKLLTPNEKPNLWGDMRYERPFQLFGRKGCVSWRGPKVAMGRFGGGWQWAVGFEVGGSTIILNLLVFCIRFQFKRKE
jgi:hypothetical protein